VAKHAYWLMYNTNGSNGAVNDLAMSHSTGGQSAYLGQHFGTWPTTIRNVTPGSWNLSIFATLAERGTSTQLAIPAHEVPTSTHHVDSHTAVPPMSCGLAAPAFCDSFREAPQPGTRSGDLNPGQWSVARIDAPFTYMGSTSPQSFVEFPTVPVTPCRAGLSTSMPEEDTQLCDAASSASGELMTTTEAQNYGLVSYRPVQPFDFTNRTGKIVFDVDAATGGGLDKWISLFVTDQPIAGASNLAQVTGLTPQNGVGFNLDLNCGSPYAKVGVGEVFTYANYLESTAYTGTNSDPCVATSAGALNHFEVDLSRQQLQVWGSNPSSDGGTTFPSLTLLATVPLSLPFSVGYVHYQVGIRAPHKYLQQFNLNAPYAVYHWKNVGFDGPVTMPDRVYPVADALSQGPNGGEDLGYELVDGTSGTPQGMYTCCGLTKVAPFSLAGVNLAGATSAELTFDVYATQADSFNANTLAIKYRFNGGAWQTPNPAPPYHTLLNQNCPLCPGGQTSENWWMALAVPIPLSDLVSGTNTLEFTSAHASQGEPLIIANIDLVVSTGEEATKGIPLLPPASASPTATRTAVPGKGRTRKTVTERQVQNGTSTCKFQSSPKPVTVALCETFNNPAGIGSRSGGLNGVLWGVSRASGNVNLGGANDAWAPTQEDQCGTDVQVQPENDVTICNGQLVEASDDGGTVTTLAMYPRQPFDIAGRTGTVVFDVSNNTQGSHAAWPEFWYTDQPVPAPFVHEATWQATPRNGFGVRFAAVCAAGTGADCGANCPNTNTVPVFTVDSADVVRDYESYDSFVGTSGAMTVTRLNCVTEPTAPDQLNHIELRISQNEIDVYATNAGTTGPLVEIATITNVNLTLTRGLIWLEDVHYNGNKLNTQREHTFTWDNVGFDGPTLPRDLGFDVNDSLIGTATLQDGNIGANLGWAVPSDGTTLSLSVPKVSDVAQASGGLLTYTFYSYSEVTISYRLNNGPWHAVPWPYPDNTTYSWRTLAVPISLSEVHTGTNTVQFRASGGAVIANIDLIMAGAGGIVPATP
jgi:hypothetical protein